MKALLRLSQPKVGQWPIGTPLYYNGDKNEYIVDSEPYIEGTGYYSLRIWVNYLSNNRWERGWASLQGLSFVRNGPKMIELFPELFNK